MIFILCLFLWVLAGIGFNHLLRRKIFLQKSKSQKLTRPIDFIFLLWVLLLVAGSVVFFASGYFSLLPLHRVVLSLVMVGITGGGFYLLYSPQWQAHVIASRLIEIVLFLGTLVSLFISVAILLTLLWQSVRFFSITPLFQFLFSTNWNPSGGVDFGALPIFWGTLVITLIAMVVATPLGILTAVYLHDYCNKKLAAWLKPILELLAGVPTVVYGFFAILIVSPLIKYLFGLVGISASSENALAAGLVMGIAITPIISSLSQDALNAVPKELKEASLGLGATRSETMRQVVLPYASGGIFAAILIAISRAVGETMIVVMAASLTANLTINPLESLTTATVQIVSLLTGDSSFNSPQTLSAYGLGLFLFIMTLFINSLSIKLNRQQKLKGRL